MGLGRILGVWECFRVLAYFEGVGITVDVRQRLDAPRLAVSQDREDNVAIGPLPREPLNPPKTREPASAVPALEAWGVEH